MAIAMICRVINVRDIFLRNMVGCRFCGVNIGGVLLSKRGFVSGPYCGANSWLERMLTVRGIPFYNSMTQSSLLLFIFEY